MGGVQPEQSAYNQEVRTMEHWRNYMDPKWTDSCPAHGNNPFLLYVVFQSWIRVEAKIPFPNSFSTMAEITPTTSLCCGSTRESENPTQSLRFIISENIPVSSVAAQWMNKDCIHVRRKKLVPDVTTLQACWWPTFRKTCSLNSALGEIKAYCQCVLNACWWWYTSYRG